MSNPNEPGAPPRATPGAPLKRPRPNTPPQNLLNNNDPNQPGAPRRRLFPRAAFLEDDEAHYRERAIQRILERYDIGDIVEGMYQAQGVTELYRISGPTNEIPERHLVHIRHINERFGGKRKTKRSKRGKRTKRSKRGKRSTRRA